MLAFGAAGRNPADRKLGRPIILAAVAGLLATGRAAQPAPPPATEDDSVQLPDLQVFGGYTRDYFGQALLDVAHHREFTSRRIRNAAVPGPFIFTYHFEPPAGLTNISCFDAARRAGQVMILRRADGQRPPARRTLFLI
jgi:hypothetical protein